MSIYTDCRVAAQMLMDTPSLRMMTMGPEGIFTELDVLFVAAQTLHPDMAEPDLVQWMTDAARDCSNRLGTLFRDGEIARFGPVRINAQYEPDYVRFDSKIVYAAPGRVREVATPNGIFPALAFETTPIPTKQGRVPGSNRNDFEPWSEQPHLLRDKTDDATPEQREIRRLKLRSAALERLLDEASSREERLRTLLAAQIPAHDYESLIASLNPN